MKKPFYLVGLAALALAGCSDNDFLGGIENVLESKGNREITFAAGGGKISRGEVITGKDAADKLGGHFTVYGWKTNTDASGETDGAHEDVYKDYLLTWASNTAGTTESNTANWEYVGNTSQPIDGEGVTQTIKYWDYSTSRYDFIAWSIADGGAVLKERPTVSSTSVAPGLTFNAATASHLGSVYVSDKYTATPEGDLPADNVLKNASSAKNTIGAYRGKETGDNAVKLQFRSLAAKVRIGLYETIPGYQVSDVVFYKENATKAYDYAYSEDDADYLSDQTNATLFTATDAFVRSGEVEVLYHDKTYMGDDTKLDNTAYTSLANTTKSSFFAFGQLTNTKGTGAKTAIAANEAIGTTSNTATMSIGNDENTLYTYVFPMETNTEPLHLKVNYKLTSTDGSKETILITGANAVVPVNFAQWMANYAYTYLFKISDNTNGGTNPDSGPEGLYPITFDAVVVDAQEGYQETITTVNDNSITTYQNGSEITVNDEYLSTNGDIYVAIKGLPNLSASNLKLFVVEDQDAKETLTEEVAANYMNNGMIFTNVTDDQLTIETSAFTVPNSSGAGHGIDFDANKVAHFTPAENTVYVVEYTTGGIKSYKVIKVDNANATQSYTTTMASSLSAATNEPLAFTIKNGTYDVTGAKSLVVVKKGSETVTDQFVIAETSEGNYTVTPNTAVAGTDYKVSFNGTDATTFTVTAPVWNNGTTDVTSVVVEEGHSITVKLLNKTGGSAIEGVTPKVPAGLKATKTNGSGQTTITAISGESGDKTVSYNGSELTVKVDKFTLTLDHNGILNVGDTEHNSTTLTLANAGTGTTVDAQTIASSTTATAAGGTLSGGSMTVTALAKGTTTFSYGNAKANLEVVNYVLTADNTAKTITLKKDGAALSGQVFTTESGVTVTATSTTGVYKVSGSAGSHKIEFKYKGVVVADVNITL